MIIHDVASTRDTGLGPEHGIHETNPGWDKDKTRPHLLDHNLRLNQRQYLVEMHLFPALRNHPQRTTNPEEAGAFFIEYSPYLNHQSYPCNTRTTKQWEQDLATELENNKWYQRNGGKDHFIFYMKYNIALPKPLTAVLEKGVNVITTDRYLLRSFLFPPDQH